MQGGGGLGVGQIESKAFVITPTFDMKILKELHQKEVKF